MGEHEAGDRPWTESCASSRRAESAPRLGGNKDTAPRTPARTRRASTSRKGWWTTLGARSTLTPVSRGAYAFLFDEDSPAIRETFGHGPRSAFMGITLRQFRKEVFRIRRGSLLLHFQADRPVEVNIWAWPAE